MKLQSRDSPFEQANLRSPGRDRRRSIDTDTGSVKRNLKGVSSRVRIGKRSDFQGDGVRRRIVAPAAGR